MRIDKIDFSDSFLKQHKRAPSKIRKAWIIKLELFKKNPVDQRLNNHSLKGKLSGYRSINITGDWRALYSEYRDKKDNKVIIFEVLGTHSQLYK